MYLSLHCHHQNDSCIKTGSDESHLNVSGCVLSPLSAAASGSSDVGLISWCKAGSLSHRPTCIHDRVMSLVHRQQSLRQSAYKFITRPTDTGYSLSLIGQPDIRQPEDMKPHIINRHRYLQFRICLLLITRKTDPPPPPPPALSPFFVLINNKLLKQE